MNAKEFIKQRIQNDWNVKVYLGFYEDEEIDMFEMMELYAESKAKNLPTTGVSERKWTVDEIIERLESFKNIEAAPAWFNTYGR